MTTDLIKNTYKSFEKNPEQLGIQNVFTPVDELVKIFDFKKEIENKTNIGILFNVEFLEYFLRDSNYITNKKFTFFYDSEIDHCMAWSIVNNNKNVELVSIEDISTKKIETLKDKIMPKHFDVLFSNPPYKNIDLKLIKVLTNNNIADKMIIVHPATFLFGHNKNNNTQEDVKKTKMLKEVTFFWGNKMFDDTLLAHAHCITVWDKNHNSDQITVHDRAFTERKEIYNTDEFTYTINVNDITVHSKIAEKAAKFLHKFENCDSIINHQTNYKTGKRTKWGFKIASIRTGLYYDNRELGYAEFYSMLGKGPTALKNALVDENYVRVSNSKVGKTYTHDLMMWYFDTKEERDNFINYLKLKSTRFLLSLIKIGTIIVSVKATRAIPWMDFTKHYSEEDLKKAWGIDEELWDYIDKFIPDYYEDYKEIAK